MAEAIRRGGFTVEEAAGGAAGLALARERQPDAIVLDVIMPDQDGWSVLHEIKADQQLCVIPVILATVVTDREMGLAFGAVEHLTKPVDPVRLLQTLEAIAGGARRDVLVVDDDPSTRNLCRRILTREGWKVREAADGAGGLEQLSVQRPTLMLLDLMMPGMDGFEVLERLQAMPDLSDLPVIVITSKDLSGDELRWLKSRTSDVVRKGLRGRTDLLEAVKRHVRVKTVA
jgi:CheY-like chemotaxis protein